MPRSALLIPGLVDPRSHPGGKYPTEEDFITETPGAAAGGVTTMACIVRVPRLGQPFKETKLPEDVISFARRRDLPENRLPSRQEAVREEQPDRHLLHLHDEHDAARGGNFEVR